MKITNSRFLIKSLCIAMMLLSTGCASSYSTGGIRTVKRDANGNVIKEEEPKKVEAPKPEPAPIPEPEPEPIVEEKKDDSDAEYSRSVGNLDVSKDTFENDKKLVLSTIDELAIVMKDRNYKLWCSYIDQESIDYWSRPVNLRKAQKKLPIKGLQLKSLEDYFKFVFIPSRKESKVDEIRYVSKNYVKAIAVKDEQEVVYYYFNKIGDKWMVHLPTIED